MFSEADLKTIAEKGLNVEEVNAQINQFESGIPPLSIVKPAIPKDGIRSLTDKQKEEYISTFDKQPSKFKKEKFIPASGAASRMFKNLYDVMNTYKGSEEEYLEIMADRNFNSIYYVCQNLQHFAFYGDWADAVSKSGSSMEALRKSKDIKFLMNSLLTPQGLNYGNLPKGLLKFHRSNNGNRTPVEEHFIEGAHYAKNGKKVRLHFTVSPQHLSLFEAHVEEIKPVYEKMFKVKYDVVFSTQKPETDTIAVDENNKPFRTANGELVFRPAGHGALIENLNMINKDLVYIKNIDNVTQDRFKQDTYDYKKALGGLLITTKKQADKFIKLLNKKVDQELLSKVETFLIKKLSLKLPQSYGSLSMKEKTEFLKNKLNRPMRVCGMVRNMGEPGGGPYWVRNNDDTLSLQIVESAQFDADNKHIMQDATHFNPVDLVCAVKDYRGRKFDLTQYVDPDTALISEKSMEGKPLKALERPGLWNGAMANWNTLFVEVPASTFSPVKTINDLLREEHLSEKDLIAGADGEDMF